MGNSQRAEGPVVVEDLVQETVMGSFYSRETFRLRLIQTRQVPQVHDIHLHTGTRNKCSRLIYVTDEDPSEEETVN